MTGKRSIENRLGELEGETESDSSGITVAYSTPGTDELEDSNGEPIDKDGVRGFLVVINRTLVMTREQAEREGRTILGPAENAVDDAVQVSVTDRSNSRTSIEQ